MRNKNKEVRIEEVAKELGVSKPYAYKLVREMNEELKKKGFPTKREALEWERTFLQQQNVDLEMTFENFVAIYVADMKSRIKENTWVTKEHIFYKKLVPYFGKQKMCDIHSKEVIAWQNEMLGYRNKNGNPWC